MERKNINSISELKNVVVSKITSHSNLNKNYRLYPQINNDKCIKCGKCVSICSESGHNALKRAKSRIETDYYACKGCSLCSHICPQEAIKMKNS